MARTTQSSFSFLNLEPLSKAAKGKMPKAYRALFAAETAVEARRNAFSSLLEAIESDWIGAVPSAVQIPNRRRALLALYALVNGSPMDGCSDSDLEKMIKSVLPQPSKRATHAVAAAARFAAV